MVAWPPLLKALLPSGSQFVAAAIPAFTSRPAGQRPGDVVPKRIAVRQSAVTMNAAWAQAMVAQLQNALEGFDTGTMALQKELKTLRRLALGATVVAIASSIVAVLAVLR